MRQKIILACTATCISTSIYAQSKITIYGKIDASLTRANWSQGTSGIAGQGMSVAGGNLQRLDSNTGAGGNRLGFSAQEDLGAGLSAVALLENGFSTDTGAITNSGAFWGRQIYVGLKTQNWSLTAGRQYSTLDLVETALDPQANMFWGNIGGSVVGLSVSQIGSASSGTLGAITRADNSILLTGSSGPFKGQMMVAFGNETHSRAGQLFNPGVYYTSGPLMLAASYARYRQAVDNAANPLNPKWQSMWVLGGSYNFNFAKFYMGASHVSRANLATYTPSAQTAWNSMYGYWIGAAVPINPSSRFTMTVGGNNYKNVKKPNGKAWQIGAVYEYFLSKRTEVYISGGFRNNDEYSQSTFGSTLQTASTVTGYGIDYPTSPHI